ncbi:DNA-binding transcriptional LysR family regulator [Pseudomonas duriflava]|uniref:DNA-binding transcriptional LysR family regulator n=1 Tax=Pseudomonas duriflava TaxID=459528 RepID=A0A562QFU4_9PSED|nr:LysR family transcriptional regulator [Pseudomonas duriflava]TWI55618.1 DNA-binding transcriptional LysR family regulator [Pseudomonas duriflava]
MNNSISLVALRLFVRVASAGSFTQAAADFHLPASSVSRHISALETALGQRLLYRHTRAVRLTEAGQRYYLQVREALAQLDMAAEQIDGDTAEPSGTLRLNAAIALGRLHLVPLLVEFQKRYPRIDVEMTLTDAFIDPVQEGADVTFRVGRLDDSSLVARPLGMQRFMVCAAPVYLERHGNPQRPEDLVHHNCLVYKGVRGTRQWYFRAEASAAFRAYPAQGSFRSNNAESLLEAAIMGEGIVLFPTWLVYKSLRSGALVPLLTEWEGSEELETNAIHLIYPENRLRSTKVKVFLDFLFEYLGDPPYWDAWQQL